MNTSRMQWAIWGGTRLLLVVLLATIESGSFSDLNYYRESLASLHTHGVGGTLAEYPVPAFLVLALPYALLAVVGATDAYQFVILVLVLVLDGVFLRMLVRSVDRHATTTGSRPDRLPVWCWLAATPALGALAYARFDLLPGVLIALALLVFTSSPRRAAILGGLATGVKYTPALVLPGLAAPRRVRWQVVATGAVTGVGLVAVSILVGGWSRVMSPLDYQGHRGLQIESLAATPVMVRRVFEPAPYRVHFATSLSWEIEGPWTQGLMLAAAVFTAVLTALVLVLWLFAWRRLEDPEIALPAVIWLTLGSLTAFVASSKVFSPQYLLWLLPAACAGLAVVGGRQSRRLRRWTAGLLAVAVLTHMIFPHGYVSLINDSGWGGVVVALLVVRNLMIAALCVTALWAAYDEIRRVPRRPTDHGEIPASS